VTQPLPAFTKTVPLPDRLISDSSVESNLPAQKLFTVTRSAIRLIHRVVRGSLQDHRRFPPQIEDFPAVPVRY